MKIGSWIAKSVTERVSTRLIDVPNYRKVVVSLTTLNFRMMALLCYAVASVQNGNTLCATTWQIAKPDVLSATGTRKSSSAEPAKFAPLRMASRSPTVRPTTQVEPPVHTTTNQLAMLDKPLTAKITPLILTMLSRHTRNTRPSHSRITSRSTVDLPTPFHHPTLRQHLRDHHRILNRTTRRTARLPSWRSIRLPRRVLFRCTPSDKLADAKTFRCSTPITYSRMAQLGPRRHPLPLHIRAQVGHPPKHPLHIPPATRRYRRRRPHHRHRTTRARNALQRPALAPHLRILQQRQRHRMGLRPPQPCSRSKPGEENPTSLPSVAVVVVVAYPITLQVHSRKLLHNIEHPNLGHFSFFFYFALLRCSPSSLCAAFAHTGDCVEHFVGVSTPHSVSGLNRGVFFCCRFCITKLYSPL